AAWKAVESCVAKMRDGRQAFFQFLPEGEDPDSIVRKGGLSGFEQRLKESLPLSSFLFREIERDVNVHTPDGKSRVWEICKPLISAMPDGSFKDRMIEELHRRAGNPNKLERAYLGTGKDLRSSKMDTFEAASAYKKSARVVSPPRPTLVRGAISLLLQKPSLALALEPPYGFIGLRQPGTDLLVELMAEVCNRPDITTGALINRFSERDEYPALQKLASQLVTGEESLLQEEFNDVIVQLEKQAVQQRIEELQAKNRDGGLDEADKYELRALLQARIGRG
ncbi:MAG TPA: DNA primase, partial [Pseudoxanthomonas sp.]|nr:DNA primase [Pseudoxanthomonas sp.]